MRWLLVPHGETDANRQGRYEGHADSELNGRGRMQAQALAQRLEQERIRAVHASDLWRARQTAEIAVHGRGIPLVLDARLRERGFGEWEGCLKSAIQEQYPEGLPELPPGGEDVERVVKRLEDFRRHLNEPGHGEEECLLLVGHRGSLRMLLCLLLGMAPGRHWQLHLEQASLSEAYVGPRGSVLTRLNDTHHLEGL